MIAGAARLRPASFHRHAMHLPRDRDPGVLLHLTGEATSASLARILIKAGVHRVGVLHGGSTNGSGGPSDATQDGGTPSDPDAAPPEIQSAQTVPLDGTRAGIIFSGLPYRVSW